MTNSKRRLTSKIVSLAIALTSLNGIQVAHAQAIVESPCVSNSLTEDLINLLNRASYPDIPRKGPTGMPMSAEMAQAQQRVLALKLSLEKTFAGRLTQLDSAACFSPDPKTEPEVVLLSELDKYFETVTRYEGLKIMMGEKTDPNAWDVQYGLKLPLKDISNRRFLEVASTFAQNAVLLPVEGYDRQHIIQEIAKGAHYVSHLEVIDGEWQVTFRVNPAFVKDAEEVAFAMRPGLKTSLQYAAHFSITRLYESLALTRYLMMRKPSDLPAPSQAAQDRFASMKVARSLMLREYQTRLEELRKPLVYKIVLDAAETSGAWVLNDEFYGKMAILAGQTAKPSTPEELKQVNKEEIAAFSRSLSGLLNLVDITDWKDLPRFLLREGKRLSLRALYLRTPESRARLSEEAQIELAAYIDERSERFASEVLSKGPLKDLDEVGTWEIQDAMLKARHEFQQKVEESAIKIRDFREEEITAGRMYGAQAAQIEMLELSPSNKEAAGSIVGQRSYLESYQTYKLRLSGLLTEFTLKGQPVPESMTLTELSKRIRELTWNPKALEGKVPPKYLQALPPAQPISSWYNVFAKSPNVRQKELYDWMTLGRLLKFNVFEELPKDTEPLVKNMKLDDTLMGPINQAENRGYQTEVKKAHLSRSPLLGGTVQIRTPGPRGPLPYSVELWTLLANENETSAGKARLVSRQLPVVESKIHEAAHEISEQLAKVDAIEGEDISGLSKNMLEVAARSSQIVSSIEQYASFQSSYSRMRQDLLTPNMLSREFAKFSEFANNMWLIAGMTAVQLLSNRVAPLGFIDKLLTPFCGPRLKCTMPLIYGMLGISMTEQAVRGFILEPANLRIVQNYFECGSGAPCVALYTDVARQEDVMNAPRSQFVGTLTNLALIWGSIRAATALLNKSASLFGGMSAKTVYKINDDFQALGLNMNVPFNADTLRAAAQDAIKKVRLNPDAAARAQGEAYVVQVYSRIEATLQKEAGSWQAFFQTYQKDFAKVGLTRDNWADSNALLRAFGDLENRYMAGQLLRSEYQEQMGTLVNIYQRMLPIWNQMEQHPIMIGYFESMFSLAGKSSAYSLKNAARGLRADYNNGFLKYMDNFYGEGKGARIDAIMENITREIKESPGLRQQRVDQLSQYLRTEVSK